MLRRGYTQHEHLDEVGVIHMNGRVYDPLIGRMMSADPINTDPQNLQRHNRYAYVLNNPLLFTDPSGFDGWSNFRDNVVKPVVVIAIAYYTGQWALAANGLGWGAVGAGALGGFASGAAGAALYGGNLQQSMRAGAIGGATGAAFGYVGSNYVAGSMANYTGHAVVGCVSAVAQGGKCGSGAAAALLGKWTTNQFTHVPPGQFDAWQFSATVVAGGMGSVITGGSFQNGARTAAYGYLFNWMAQQQGCTASNYMDCAIGDRDKKQSTNNSSNSAGSIVKGIIPISSAPLVREPIGGSIETQTAWGEMVAVTRESAIDKGLYFGGRGIDLIVSKIVSFFASMAINNSQGVDVNSSNQKN